jgi:hypothetical protein
MKAICASCRSEGRPELVGEQAPLDDPTEVRGICWTHKLQALLTTKHASGGRPGRKPDSLMRFVVIVARHAPDLFNRVSEQFFDDPRVGVVLDRRRAERRRQAAPGPHRRTRDRRAALDYWHDLRCHPLVVVPSRRRLEAGRVLAVPSAPSPEALSMESGDRTPTARQRIEAWIVESQTIIAQVIPAFFQERDGLQYRAEAAEERAEQLTKLAHELQAQVSTLQVEIDELRRLRAEMAESVQACLAEIERLTSDIRAAVRQR